MAACLSSGTSDSPQHPMERQLTVFKKDSDGGTLFNSGDVKTPIKEASLLSGYMQVVLLIFSDFLYFFYCKLVVGRYTH